MSVPGVRDGGVNVDIRPASKDAVPLPISLVQPDSGGFADVHDTGLVPDSPPETQDAAVTVDLPALQDSDQASEVAPLAQCATQVLDSVLFPVGGTVHGPRVDGVVCDNGLGTSFNGPEDVSFDPPYLEDFYTTTVYTGAVPRNSNAPGAYGFLIRAPADALSADLSGWTGASAPTVGSYDSTRNCGGLDFNVTLPVPPGVVCTSVHGPCDPGCELVGYEFATCEPANAHLHYLARSVASCGAYADQPAQGDWQLTVTSVSPLAVPMRYWNFKTHGHLTATLVNQADASDKVLLNLDF